jgi:hypothetical protein
MEKDIKKKLIMPFISCLCFVVCSVINIYLGIEHHEPWRILAASVGGIFFLTLIILIIWQVIKEGRKAA